MHKFQRIGIIDHRASFSASAQASARLVREHHLAVRSDVSAAERDCDLLADNGWKGRRSEVSPRLRPVRVSNVSLVMVGVGSARPSESDNFSTDSYARPIPSAQSSKEC
jgi:hypothetical protein